MFELPLLNTVILLSSGVILCPKSKKNYEIPIHKYKGFLLAIKSRLLYFVGKALLYFKELYPGTLQPGSCRGFMPTRVLNSSVLPFSTPRVHSSKRIGPHNYEILCIFIGSLLGDGLYSENALLKFEQSIIHKEYLVHLFEKFIGYYKGSSPFNLRFIIMQCEYNFFTNNVVDLLLRFNPLSFTFLFLVSPSIFLS